MDTRIKQGEFEELEAIISDHFGPRQRHHDTAEEAEQPHAVDGEEGVGVDVDQVVERQIQVFAESVPEEEPGNNEEEENDISETRQALVTACKCSKHCYDQFTEAQIFDHILNVREMEKNEKELYVMGTLVSNCKDSATTRRGERKQVHFSYKFAGKNVCLEVYKIVFDNGEKQLRNILKHMKVKVTVPRIHGNKSKRPHNALAFGGIKKVVQFIINFGDENGIPLPAAPRGRDDIPPVYIHSSYSKKAINKLYVSSCEEGQRSVKYSIFAQIWNSCCGHIKIAKPKDDVCGTCEKLRKRSQDVVGVTGCCR